MLGLPTYLFMVCLHLCLVFRYTYSWFVCIYAGSFDILIHGLFAFMLGLSTYLFMVCLHLCWVFRHTYSWFVCIYVGSFDMLIHGLFAFMLGLSTYLFMVCLHLCWIIINTIANQSKTHLMHCLFVQNNRFDNTRKELEH